MKIVFVQDDFAVIEADIEADIKVGKRIVVSDLTPAITGMLLAPQVDQELLEQLQQQVKGGAL